jgi:small subunit ribosomal protein S15
MPSITKEKKVEFVSVFGKDAVDTGNPKVQVAILTERIKNLTEHVKINKKDKHCIRGLLKLVSKRRKLLDFYSRQDIEGYRALIKELGLRK